MCRSGAVKVYPRRKFSKQVASTGPLPKELLGSRSLFRGAPLGEMLSWRKGGHLNSAGNTLVHLFLGRAPSFQALKAYERPINHRHRSGQV